MLVTDGVCVKMRNLTQEVWVAESHGIVGGKSKKN
jgi:hypothetical protein